MSVAWKELSLGGREHKTDGLLKHLGLAEAGGFRAGATASGLAISPSTGRGLEIGYHSSTPLGYLYCLNRDTGVAEDLQLIAKNITLTPSGGGSLTLPANCVGTSQLQANAVQQQLGYYYGAPNQGYSTTGAWYESVIQTPSVACSGAMCRFEVVVCYGLSAGALVYFGLYQDHANWLPSLAVQSAQAGEYWTTSFTVYPTPTAGNHIFGVGLYHSAGTLTVTSLAYSRLYVTEQKR